MKVKLRARDATQGQIDAYQEYRRRAGDPLSAHEVSWALHDAAPDDATRALVDLLWAIQQLRHGPNSEYAVYARYVDTYLGKFAQTDEGAALIRQVEERDDG